MNDVLPKKAVFIWARGSDINDQLLQAYATAKGNGYLVAVWCDPAHRNRFGNDFMDDSKRDYIMNQCFGGFLQGGAQLIRVFIYDHSFWINGAQQLEFYDVPGNDDYVLPYDELKDTGMANGGIDCQNKCMVVRGKKSGRGIPPLCSDGWIVITTQNENEEVEPDQYNISGHLLYDCKTHHKNEVDRLANIQHPKICQ